MTEIQVVIDTNVLLVSIPTRSPYRPIFDAILTGKIELIISNEILSEYIEIIGNRAHPTVAHNIADALINRPNVKKIEADYRWGLIQADPDDNKFVDCAIAGGASYLVTNDRHFQVLKTIPFPRVDIVSLEEFMGMLNG